MDTASDSSDGEQDLPVGARAPVTMETGRGLKPQMDNIFAEVEKSLPSIDFDMSDMSSDSEEPVIFHRNLKVSEHDYDDEKDLDTSLSGESALDFFKSPPGMIQIPSVDKNNTSLSDSSNLTFDNDLVALLAAQEVTTLLEDEGEENVSSWKDLERIARRDKQRQKEREQGPPPPPTTATTSTPLEHTRPDNTAPPHSNSQTPFADNRQMGLVEAGDLLLAQLSENNRASGSSLFGGRTVDLDIVVSRAERNRAAATDEALSRDTNRHDAGTGMDDDFSRDMNNSDIPERKIRSTELDSNRELERIEQDRKAQEKKQREEREVKERRRKEEREELRRRDKELALSYMSAKAPNLSMQILDSIDLDTSLEDDNELARWSPPPSLRAQLEQQQAARVNAAPTTSSASSSAAARHSGRGDGDGKAVAGTETLTLIQKLAQFSLKQSGRDYDPSVIDPQTGADIGIPTTPRPTTTSATTAAVAPSTKRDTVGSKTSSAGTSTTSAGSSTGVAVPDAAGVAGKDSTGAKDVTPMAALLESLNKRKPEPDTVFIDLRGFEQHQKEEKERMTSVSRVLGLEQQSMGAESSDSEDEDKWLTQRQQVKRTITTRGSATPSFKQQRLKQAQPARVINLQKKTTSSRGVSTSSCGVSASLGATGDAGSDGASARSTEDDSNLKAEEKAALLAREKEKERQKEAARMAREEKEKIRSARLRMLHHLEGLRSTGAVSETKPCGENTPVLFDLEASYEPRLPVLPTSLDKEEVLLLTVNLSSNGEIALHNSRSSKTSTENVINALPKSYLSLICWLVSLIPHDFHLVKQWLECPEEGVDHYPEGFPPFHVLGLQQLLVDGNLCLAIAICPSPIFMFHKDDRRDRLLKKGKKGDETTRFYKFVDTFVSRNSLSTVISWPRYLGNEPAEKEEELSEYQIPLTFSNPHLPFLGKPMSAYMQLHKDPGAVESIFNKDVGFFWQTVDSQESGYQYRQKDVGGENTPQNTLFLLSKQALFRPQVVHETLFRVVSQSLDISGLRVLYPSSDTSPEHKNINSPFPAGFSAVPSPGSSSEGVTPVLAVAVRGPHARIRLTSIIGPMDFALAKKTDPYSLTALFGNPKTGLQIFCPRNLERAKTELVRWFGGRAPEKGSMEVGLPYKLKEYDYAVGGGVGGGSSSGAAATGRGKKGKRGSSGDPLLEPKPSRPPAALTATTLSHVVMVISPIVPIWVLGFLVSLMQQKAAFQPRGIRRLCLSVKKANTLGVPSAVHSFFCPGVNLDVADIDSGKQQQESCSPCTLLLLERENASHHASSLVQILVNELKSENIVERMEDRAISKFDLITLFHTTDYSDSLLVSLGGDFSKCPSFDPMCDVRGPMPPLYSNKELEQVVVLILLGKDLLKDWGSFLQKLQTFSTTNSWLSDFELLGMKWLAGMNTFQTREVTPYEIGDVRWRSSVQFLAHEPAVVFAIRGVNAFKKLEPFVCLPVTTPTTTIPPNSTSARLRSRDAPHPTRLMSRSPKETYMFVRLFFSAHELFPDPDSRMLLPCLPESRLYYDTLEWTELGNVEGSKPRILLKSVEEQDLTQENVPEMLLCDGIPLTTFLLIKPRAARKHLAKIVRRVLHEGFTIVGFRLNLMSSQLAQRFLALEFENASQLHDLHLEYLTSEPCIYMALCRENAVKKLRDLIGPEDPLQARRQNQFYWRGIYGADSVHNGLYASRTYIEAMWDQKAFFPDGLCCNPTYDLQMEQIPCPAVDGMLDINFHKRRHAVRTDANLHDKPGMPHISATEQKAHTLLMQTTCLVLPPSLTRRCCRDGSKEAPFEEILSLLLSRGFELVGGRMVWMSQQQAEQFLHILHSGSFEAVSQLTCGPSLVLALERDNAVVAFESTLGTSEEAQTVISAYGKDLRRPADLKQASQLLALFFDRLMPGSQMEIQPVLAADTSSAHK